MTGLRQADDLPDENRAAPAPAVQSNRRMVVAIAVLVVAWGAVMLNRNAIRARWWEYRLTVTEDPAERARYLALLANLGTAGLPAAARLLHQDEPALRSYGVALLHSIDDEYAVELLREATADADPTIRDNAIRALGWRGDIEWLRQLVNSPDERSAVDAVAALGSIGSDQAVDALIGLLPQHPGVAVRVQAIECLGELAVPRCVSALKSCLDDQAVFVGQTIAERMAGEAIGSLYPDQSVDTPARRTVADFAAKALERITPSAESTPP